MEKLSHLVINLDQELELFLKIKKLEVYDLQFKFARRETMEDEEMIVCDIPHQSIATSALTGYHLKIWVTEKSKYIYWLKYI